ncbi:acetate kinase, partial [bacterium]|nr:acetate kinase [bacterium]
PSRTLLASGSPIFSQRPEGRLTHRVGGRRDVTERAFPDHAVALEEVLARLSGDGGVLERPGMLGGVGHRLVHGGESFSEPVLVDDAVIDAVRRNIPLAPLHNPANLLGLEVGRKLLPGVPQVGVFDTAFHQRMPRAAYLYALPYELYEEHRIRRYGFHGTSHAYVARRAAAVLQRPAADLRIITCHLGNGASMAAVRGGRSVDTSMGFTPLEGLVMGTRPGDFDPAIVLFLQESLGMSAAEAGTLLNKKSGLLGLTGRTNDMREIETAAAGGDERARIAIEVYCHRVKKTIGAYTAVLGEVDALVFTAGVGENSPLVREKSVDGLAAMGYAIDGKRNAAATGGTEADISASGSRARVLVVPTDEEGAIAEETFGILGER